LAHPNSNSIFAPWPSGVAMATEANNRGPITLQTKTATVEIVLDYPPDGGLGAIALSISQVAR
jgi:hypothetical protein